MIQFPKPEMDQFLKTLSINDFVVNSDESKVVFSTNLNGYYNLWAMNLPQQFPVQLTFKNQVCMGLLYDKSGKFILAGFDQDGDECAQYYAVHPSGGKLKQLINNEKTRNFNPLLSKDGQYLYYSSAKNNPTYLNVYRYHIETEQEELFLEGKEGMTFLDGWSPNEESYISSTVFANTHSLAYVHTEREKLCLTEKEEEAHTVTGSLFTAEDTIYLITNFKENFTYLAEFNIVTKQFRKVVGLDHESFSSIHYDKSNHIIYLTSEKGVEDYLYAYSLDHNTLQKVEIPCDIIEKLVVHDSGNLYLLGRSAIKPHNIYQLKKGEKWKQLTEYRVPGVEESELVEPATIYYPSFDDLEIEALWFEANKEVNNGQVIFWPHGGPQAAERKSFRSYFQFLINHGYSIFAPNFRGSTGYGLSFMKMVEGDWGDGPRLDNIAGIEWLIEKGYTKKGDILLMGGSYGGYMALLLHGRHPEYFKAVVDIFGPSNLFSFIESVPEDWKPIMDQWVGNPLKDKEKLTEYSPITYLEAMTKPMLVIQGANDPRVVKEESDQIVQALRKKGREVKYILLQDEGHGFSKKENEQLVFEEVLSFFDQHTKKTADTNS
ncbi:S9 family peptidase [Cytobacillus kochii]|uniref:S9 family peptidase n=1 Tax=Cytobacillus kochii TaxID=859143 RepID=UPI00248138BE|nr:prolyl oligopeptidase family serine peptidase [Cytobacillus kochii]